ncbi:MAG TPA: AIM24 family protein, partial [Myxococcales bacterium]|nr:AIM24 family protein [Myxococcales bacterium]
MPQYEIITKEGQKMVKVTLRGDSVRTESGALHYYRGAIKMESKAPSAGGLISGMLSGETIFKPTYAGTGEVFLGPPHFGEYSILELNNSAWVLDQGAYVCSDEGIEVSAHRNKALSAMLGGEGTFQTKVSGTGKVVIQAPGKLERVDLNGERLAVDGSFAVARTESVDFTVERSSRSIMGSMTSGEGLLNTYNGHGQVLLSPVPNLYKNLMGFGSMASLRPATTTKTSPLNYLMTCGCIVLMVGGGIG